VAEKDKTDLRSDLLMQAVRNLILRYLRDHRGATASEIIERAGICKSHFYAIMGSTSGYYPTIKTVLLLLNAINCDLEIVEKLPAGLRRESKTSKQINFES
jgi:transcriptional regulator with XRE-family HTH domain